LSALVLVSGNDAKVIEGAEKDLPSITGQKPIVTKAKKSIAKFLNFREGMPIGMKVTLRRERHVRFY